MLVESLLHVAWLSHTMPTHAPLVWALLTRFNSGSMESRLASMVCPSYVCSCTRQRCPQYHATVPHHADASAACACTGHHWAGGSSSHIPIPWKKRCDHKPGTRRAHLAVKIFWFAFLRFIIISPWIHDSVWWSDLAELWASTADRPHWMPHQPAGGAASSPRLKPRLRAGGAPPPTRRIVTSRVPPGETAFPDRTKRAGAGGVSTSTGVTR